MNRILLESDKELIEAIKAFDPAIGVSEDEAQQIKNELTPFILKYGFKAIMDWIIEINPKVVVWKKTYVRSGNISLEFNENPIIP